MIAAKPSLPQSPSLVVLMTGGSRGIGRAMALKLAQAGAAVVLAAKTDQPHPRLLGTIHSVAAEIEALGGQALPIRTDARDEAQLQAAVEATLQRFGRIDLLINNAGFLGLSPVAATTTKQYDLMHALNSRAPLITMRECSRALKESGGMIVNLCPPINLDPGWLGAFAPYTSTKYAMTLLSLGFAEEMRAAGVAVHTLWPSTLIATDAVGQTAGPAALARARHPRIMADALWTLWSERSRWAGQVCWLDEELLRAAGCGAFEGYAMDPDQAVQADFYVGPFGATS